MEQTFIKGYAKSVVRSTKIPANLCGAAFDVDEVAHALTDCTNIGSRPGDKRAQLLLKV